MNDSVILIINGVKVYEQPGAGSPPITPPIVPPVDPVPPVTPPVTPAIVVIRDLGPSRQGTRLDMQQGVIYASPLPVASGLFSMTTHPETPGGIQIQVSISPTPGDLGYYKTPAACYTLFGVKQCPCGSIAQPESPNVIWAPAVPNPPTSTPCVVPAGAGWYVNYQMLEGSGPMIYTWSP